MNSRSLRLLIVALFACCTSTLAATCPSSSIIIKSFSKSQYGSGVTVAVGTEPGFVLIGGGFSGQNLRESYVEATAPPVWVVTTSPVTASVGPATTTVYAIGFYDPDHCYQVSYVTSKPAGVNAQTGTASASCPSGSTLVGGGARTDRFLVENYPNTIRGDATSANTWTASFASASGFVANSTSGITAYAICLTPTGTGYSLGNFINNAGPSVGANPASSSATNPFLLVGGGFRSNGLVDASYNETRVWKSINGGYSTLGDGTAIQSVSLGLTQSSSSAPAPTSTTAPVTTSAPSKSCFGQIITSARPASQSGSWTSGSTSYQIYDIAVKNTGQCTIVRATYDSLFTGPNNPGVSQKWNIGNSPSGDQILGAPIDQVTASNGVAPGTTLNGAGVVVFNATGVTYVAKGPTVFCSASCTNSA